MLQIRNLDKNLLLASEVPFLKKNIFEIYLNYVYWSYTTSSTGPYGDINAITQLERCFQILVVLIFKIFTSFLAAEVTNIAASYKSGLSDHLRKVNNIFYQGEHQNLFLLFSPLYTQLIMIKKWMSHAKIPKELTQRLVRYHECLWRKFKGIDEQAIIDELPDTIRHELLIHMLRG